MTHQTSAAWMLAPLCTALLLGCGTPPHGDLQPMGPAVDQKVLKEWKTIHGVELVETQPRRELKGYLCHEYTLKDPDGRHYVYDASRELKGFVLPSGKAYVYERDASGEVASREVAYRTLDGCVVEILGINGSVEFEEISADMLPRP